MFVQNFGGTLLTASIDIDRFTLYRPLYVGKLTRQMRVCLWIKNRPVGNREGGMLSTASFCIDRFNFER
jgi:hypothetical protein